MHIHFQHMKKGFLLLCFAVIVHKMNVHENAQMIGTSISIQNTGEMQYPSLTICEDTVSAPVFVDGQFFETYDHWKHGINYTHRARYDLRDLFIELSSIMPNMSTFILTAGDIDDRDDFCRVTRVL